VSDTHKVSTDPVRAREYDSKHGKMVVWRLGLEGVESTAPDGLFELHKKPGNEPARGDALQVKRRQEGEFNGEPFVRLFLDYTDGGGDGGKFDRRPEHPRNEARMIHTSALSAAPVYIEQMLTLSVVDQPADEAAYWALVSAVASRLTRTYARVLEGHAQAATGPENGAGGEIPADARDLQPAKAAADDELPF
jgi:hypothetical protein